MESLHERIEYRFGLIAYVTFLSRTLSWRIQAFQIGASCPQADSNRRDASSKVDPQLLREETRAAIMPEGTRPDHGTSVLSADQPLSITVEANAAPPARKPPRARGSWQELAEPFLRGICNRLPQMLARFAPGTRPLRVFLHRARGARIGKGVWTGYDVVLHRASPGLIQIGNGVAISMRATIIAHFKEQRGVRIGEDLFIGPAAIILPNMSIARGAVIKAGSAVTHSIPALTIVVGNPAVAVSCYEIPLVTTSRLRSLCGLCDRCRRPHKIPSVRRRATV